MGEMVLTGLAFLLLASGLNVWKQGIQEYRRDLPRLRAVLEVAVLLLTSTGLLLTGSGIRAWDELFFAFIFAAMFYGCGTAIARIALAGWLDRQEKVRRQNLSQATL